MTATAPAWIGLRLYRERERRGWTLRQAAIACGVSYTAVSAAEQGKDIRLSTAMGFARAYGLSLDVLTADPRCGRCLDRGACGECGRDASDGNSSSDERNDHDR